MLRMYQKWGEMVRAMSIMDRFVVGRLTYVEVCTRVKNTRMQLGEVLIII